MKRTLLLAAIASAMVAGSVTAEPLSFNLTGGGAYRGNEGAPLGFFDGPVYGVNYGVEGRPTGRLGAEFTGPTQVTSITIERLGITAHDQNNRQPIKSFDVYADGSKAPVATIVVPSTDKGPQEALIRDRVTGEPITITATWLTLIPTAKYTHVDGDPDKPSFGDVNSAVVSLGFNGTPHAGPPVNPNLNSSTLGLVKDVTFENLGPGGGNNKSIPVDGKLHESNDGDACFWRFGDKVGDDFFGLGVEQSLTIHYDAENPVEIIASVGIALLSNAYDRIAPRWVEISANDGQSEIIYLDGNQLHYNRYDLENAFVDVEWLKITFPFTEEGEALDYENDWWSRPPGVHSFGLVEFQAFAFAQHPVPEPATMALLALGGLALLRRRK